MLTRFKASFQNVAMYRGARLAWLFASDPVFRRDHLLRLLRPKNLFQYLSFTTPNRYPRVFGFVRDQLAGVAQPQLLSFGCAGGDEVFTLRHYFPTAVITGVDINPHNVAACERRRQSTPDAAISFRRASSADDEPASFYDAIFCLAVFQHSALKNPKVKNCDKYLKFSDFDTTITGISRSLKVGGYLAIRWANFRFSDTAVSADFEPAFSLAPCGDLHPRFDRAGHRQADEEDRDVVYRKLRDR